MGFSKLKIPKICSQCNNPFEAKTLTTVYCSKSCANKASKERKKKIKEENEKEVLLENYRNKIIEIQTRPFISVSEATVLYGVSKDTIRRLIKKNLIPAHNLGERLTRISKEHLDSLFMNNVKNEQNSTEEIKMYDFDPETCYTLSEVSEKYNANPSTVNNAIRKFNIPKKKIGSYVYVSKDLIDKVFG